LFPLVRNVGGYPINLIVRMLYGCGLRVTEPLGVRIKDIDLANSKLFIMGGKGRKDRVVRIPCSLSVELRAQMDFARAIWRRDSTARIPVALPHQLAKKYPAYQFAWSWAWLFPSHRPCKHPRTGETVRWHVLECNVQRAVREASQKLGLTITPHCLRHSYATDCLDRGTNVKALQAAMGHVNAETTLGYCHAEAMSVASPLDASGVRN
jgi:integrase